MDLHAPNTQNLEVSSTQAKRPAEIQLLPDSLINKIAAGEVVERPASVIKELVENALDAGATEIEIEVRDDEQAITEMRVRDNGSGMDRRSISLAPSRHATSKLRVVEDLQGIRTYGFRGEALAAIAAVAKMRVMSRTHDATAGLCLENIPGDSWQLTEAGAPFGTEIRVQELFYNVPARRKFLKRTPTEWGYLQEAVIRQALFQEGVGFKLFRNGRLIFRLSPEGTVLQRLRTLLRVPEERLLQVESSTEAMADPIWVPRLYGHISPAEEVYGNRERLYIFVNSRAVRDRGLNHAISTAYRELSPHGRYPLVVLNLEVPLTSVDVNVHPAKAEIRFEKPSAVYHFVLNQLRKTLAANGASENTSDGQNNYHLATTSAVIADAPYKFSFADARAPSVVGLHNAPLFAPLKNFSELKIIGQWFKSYLVCERSLDGKSELILIDQHAAHERIGYERLKKAYRKDGRLAMQRLLVPEQIEISALEHGLIDEFNDSLQRLGFETEPFGGHTLLLRSLPALLNQADIKTLFRALLTDLENCGQSRALENMLDRILITLACHTMVRANHHLEPEEIRALLQQLDEIDFSVKCPHGRPVCITFPLTEIERRFGRT